MSVRMPFVRVSSSAVRASRPLRLATLVGMEISNVPAKLVAQEVGMVPLGAMAVVTGKEGTAATALTRARMAKDFMLSMVLMIEMD